MTASYIIYSGGIHILQLNTTNKEVTIFQENGDPLSDKMYDIRWKYPIITLGNTFISGGDFKNNYTLKYSYKDKLKSALGGPDKYVSTTSKDNFNLNQNLFGEPRNTGFLKEENISTSTESTNTNNDDDFDPSLLKIKFRIINDDDTRNKELLKLMEGIYSKYIKENNFDKQVFTRLINILINEIEKISFIKPSLKDIYKDHAYQIEYAYNIDTRNFEAPNENRHSNDNVWNLLCKLRDTISSIPFQKEDDDDLMQVIVT